MPEVCRFLGIVIYICTTITVHRISTLNTGNIELPWKSTPVWLKANSLVGRCTPSLIGIQFTRMS